MLFSRFIQEIEKNNLLQKNDTVVVAVSGGADSVCLLHLFYRLSQIWSLKLICAHVNHMLRSDADKDAAFVESLCKKWEIPYVMHKEDVAETARKQKSSVELVGREIRYRFFRSISADVIATAHHKNDVAETVLLHMVRGCGLNGLCGIPFKRDDGVIRPLLQFNRQDIESYLHAHALIWHEDSTNSDTCYTRNYIRHEILPKFEALNPSFSNALFRMTQILQDDEVCLNTETKNLNAVRKEKDVIFFSIEKLQNAHIALKRRVIYDVVPAYDAVNRILDLLEKKNGTIIKLPDNMEAAREYNEIAVYKTNKQEITSVTLPSTGSIQFGNYNIIVGQGGFKLKNGTYTVRTRSEGDVFSPEGMNGRKKIKDFLIDKKIPKRMRDSLPIFVSEGKIAAVSDLRRDRNFIPYHDESYIEINIKKE